MGKRQSEPTEFFGTFRQHAGACAQCRRVDLEKTATWANGCMSGVILLKNAAAATSSDIRRRHAREGV